MTEVNVQKESSVFMEDALHLGRQSNKFKCYLTESMPHHHTHGETQGCLSVESRPVIPVTQEVEAVQVGVSQVLGIQLLSCWVHRLF